MGSNGEPALAPVIPVPLIGFGEADLTHVEGSRGSRASFRRVVVGIAPSLGPRVESEIAIELDRQATVTHLEEAWIGYRAHRAAEIRAGALLVPVGMVNLRHEPTALRGVNRPETDDVIIPSTWREAGVSLRGRPLPGLAYEVALIDGLNAARFSGLNGLRDGRQEAAEAFSDSVAGVARLEAVVQPGFHFGASLYGGRAGENQPVVTRSAIALGEIDADLSRWGAGIRGEYARARIADASVIAAVVPADPIGRTIEGGWLEISWDVLHPFRARMAEPISIEPFARWERTDTQLDMPAGLAANPAERHTIDTAGVSIRPMPAISLKADYQWVRDGNGPLPSRWHIGVGWSFGGPSADRGPVGVLGDFR